MHPITVVVASPVPRVMAGPDGALWTDEQWETWDRTATEALATYLQGLATPMVPVSITVGGGVVVDRSLPGVRVVTADDEDAASWYEDAADEATQAVLAEIYGGDDEVGDEDDHGEMYEDEDDDDEEMYGERI